VGIRLRRRGIRRKMTRAVFLDRDGVLNRAVIRDGLPFPPRSVHDLEVLPDVPQALALLGQKLDALDAYLSTAPPSAPAAPPVTETRPS